MSEEVLIKQHDPVYQRYISGWSNVERLFSDFIRESKSNRGLGCTLRQIMSLREATIECRAQGSTGSWFAISGIAKEGRDTNGFQPDPYLSPRRYPLEFSFSVVSWQVDGDVRSTVSSMPIEVSRSS